MSARSRTGSASQTSGQNTNARAVRGRHPSVAQRDQRCAVATLRAALEDGNTGHRIRAAAILLDVVMKVNLDEITRRVEALEALAKVA